MACKNINIIKLNKPSEIFHSYVKSTTKTNFYFKLSDLKELIPFAAREVIDLEKINGDSLLTSLTFCSNYK